MIQSDIFQTDQIQWLPLRHNHNTQSMVAYITAMQYKQISRDASASSVIINQSVTLFCKIPELSSRGFERFAWYFFNSIVVYVILSGRRSADDVQIELMLFKFALR